ncbi:MAG: retroviral-like aspartic protease family protein [Gammaproteobacteria bacterium]|nr:retroviral-like aspartic protease family protein [Gammaproteobacteria bacterium]
MTNPAEQQRRWGKIMVGAMWLLLLGLLTLFFNDFLDKQHNPNQQIASVQRGGQQQIILQRNKYGHYVASGMINQQPVVFMLDTGATDISIPENVARRLGLQRGRAVTYQTANGPAINYTTQLDAVSLGNITLYNLPASINPNVNHEDILLGMSFLKHLEFSQKGNTLTLRQ